MSLVYVHRASLVLVPRRAGIRVLGPDPILRLTGARSGSPGGGTSSCRTPASQRCIRFLPSRYLPVLPDQSRWAQAMAARAGMVTSDVLDS